MSRTWIRRICPGCGLVAVLVACGGGGGGSAPNPVVTLASAPATSAVEAHPYRYVASASSSSGGKLQFTLLAGPAGATLTGSTVDWTPGTPAVGTPQSFRLKVEDGKATAEQAWTVTVSANRPPAFQGAAPATAKEGHAYTYDLAATDPDGDPVQYEATLLPPGATLSGTRLAWTPGTGDVGQSFDFNVRALDGFGGATDQAWSLTPTANAAPLITSQPPADVAFVQGKPVFDYALAGTDADQDILTFSLVQGPAGATLVNGILHWEPTPDQERVAQTFQVRVSDGCGGVVDQQWTKAYSGVLRGTWADVYVSASGTVKTQPSTAYGTPAPTVLIPDGAGGLRTINGVANANGTFSVPGIPPGFYWVGLGPQGYFWTDVGTLDSGFRCLGRPDVTLPTADTYLDLTLSNLDSWSGQNGMEWLVPNHPMSLVITNSQFTAGNPVPGDTAMASARLQHPAWAPLVESAKSDGLWLLQRAQAPLGNYTVQTIQKAFSLDNLTETSGGTTSITGAFAAPPISTVDVDWDISSIPAFLSQVNPSALMGWPNFYIMRQPGGLSEGFLHQAPGDLQDSFNYQPNLIWSQGPPPPQAIHQTFSFGDPFPATWPHIYKLINYVSQNTTLNGSDFARSATVTVISDTPGTPQQPLKPLISPVQHPTINGQDFFANLTGVGTSPVLAWDPPTTGRPVYYIVRATTLTALPGGGTGGSWEWRFAMRVFGTSIQIPPGVLVPGSIYSFDIRAVSAGPGFDPKVPNRLPLPIGITPCLSGLIQP